MTVSASKPITLDEFLKLPETKPASEYSGRDRILPRSPKRRWQRLRIITKFSVINSKLNQTSGNLLKDL
jgi:hypothetical protein